jgi:hypothetical protein
MPKTGYFIKKRGLLWLMAVPSGDRLLAGRAPRHSMEHHRTRVREREVFMCLVASFLSSSYKATSVLHSTLGTLSNPNDLPKAPPLHIIIGLSIHPLNTSQWKLNPRHKLLGTHSNCMETIAGADQTQ